MLRSSFIFLFLLSTTALAKIDRQATTESLRKTLVSLYVLLNDANEIPQLEQNDQNGKRLEVLLAREDDLFNEVEEGISGLEEAIGSTITASLLSSWAKIEDQFDNNPSPQEKNLALKQFLSTFKADLDIHLMPIETPQKGRGKQLFETHCTSCHNAEGKGELTASLETHPRPLDAPEFSHARSPEFMFVASMEGILGTAMPAFDQLLSTAELWDIAFYVAALPYENVEKVSLTDGEKTDVTLSLLAATTDLGLEEFSQQKGIPPERQNAVRAVWRTESPFSADTRRQSAGQGESATSRIGGPMTRFTLAVVGMCIVFAAIAFFQTRTRSPK